MKDIVIMLFALAVCQAQAAPKKKVTCLTCQDTGRVVVECPVCHGSKYVWVCHERYCYGYDSDSRGVSYCGYGATYKPIHKNCNNGRKRQNCPNCLSKSRTSSTGRTEIECPNCNGNGVLAKTYYILKNTRYIEADREYYLQKLDRYSLDQCSFISMKKMTKDELADFKIENTGCKAFDSIESLKDYIKNGEPKMLQKAGKMYFVVRDKNGVKEHEKYEIIRAFEDGDEIRSSSEDIFKRRMTDEEVENFRKINPKCRMFRDIDEFKTFILNVKAVSRPRRSS